jgi:hypothetical protein
MLCLFLMRLSTILSSATHSYFHRLVSTKKDEELVLYYAALKIHGLSQEIQPVTCVLDLEGLALL